MLSTTLCILLQFSPNPTNEQIHNINLIDLLGAHESTLVVAGIESGFVDGLTSPANATGLMQITPIAQQEINSQYHDLVFDRYNTLDNIMLGDAYLEWLGLTFTNKYQVLMAYNWGIGNVIKWRTNLEANPIPKETQNYIKKYKQVEKACGLDK